MARLLFITQRVDKDDDILGTYHRWLGELSKRLETIDVICLFRGRSELPGNVRVFSLGKENNSLEIRNCVKRRGCHATFRWKSEISCKIKYIFRFYKYIWGLRKEYDSVFVHMNPIYVVLGWWFWKLRGKKIMLWYNHPLGNLTAKVGIGLADKVFCTSPYSFAAKHKKTSLMPAGVDTDFFKPMPEVSKDDRRILYLGRISPIKKIEYLIQAVKALDDQGLDFKVLIVGSAGPSAIDKEYELRLKKMSANLSAGGRVEFKQAIPNDQTPEIYNSSGIFVNLTPSGSFDKAILEAMACGSLVVVANKVFEQLFDGELRDLCIFGEDNPADLARKIGTIFSIPPAKKLELARRLREAVVQYHSLTKLSAALSAELRTI